MKIGRIAGVSFRINPLLLLLLVVYTALGLGYEILCILAAVIIHELAHTLAAGILGVKISEVELLPFGGQAKTEDFLGLVPEREVYIALAGPLTSLALAGGVLVAGKHGGEGYLPFFMQINLVLALLICCRLCPWTEVGCCGHCWLGDSVTVKRPGVQHFWGRSLLWLLWGMGLMKLISCGKVLMLWSLGLFYSGLLARKLAFWPMLSCVTWYIRRVNYRVKVPCLSIR